MCDCKYGDEVVLKAPFWTGKKDISIDRCIAPIIQMLWDNGIRTLNSCCGHGKVYPSVVIDECEDAEKTAELLKKHDPERNWDVFQWRLIKTNKEKYE